MAGVFRGKQHVPLDLAVGRGMTPADQWIHKDEIVAAEKRSWDLWYRLDDPQRTRLLSAVRATLLRLLEDPSWVPGALDDSFQRINVIFSVTLDENEDRARMEADYLRAEMELRATLEHLAKKPDGPTA